MELAVPVLPADDLAVAKAFYVDTLGFAVGWEVSEDGHTGLLGVTRGTMQITLDCPMDGHGRRACVSLHVTSADAYYREWKQKIEGNRRRDRRSGSDGASLAGRERSARRRAAAAR